MEKKAKPLKHYLARDISWMYFNHRILQEAQREEVPLLERLTFLGIYSNNLDEFFRVRVATQSRVAECKDRSARDEREAALQELKAIGKLNASYAREYEQAVRNVTEALRKEHIYLLLLRVPLRLGFDVFSTGKLSEQKDKKRKNLPVSSLKQLYKELSALSPEERTEKYELKEDRADVIVPAGEIFLKIAETVGAAYIHVPVIGLADGIIDELCLKKEKDAQAQPVKAPASGIPAPTPRQ